MSHPKSYAKRLKIHRLLKATQCCGNDMAYTPLSEIDCAASQTLYCDTRYPLDLTPAYDWALQYRGNCISQ